MKSLDGNCKAAMFPAVRRSRGNHSDIWIEVGTIKRARVQGRFGGQACTEPTLLRQFDGQAVRMRHHLRPLSNVHPLAEFELADWADENGIRTGRALPRGGSSAGRQDWSRLGMRIRNDLHSPASPFAQITRDQCVQDIGRWIKVALQVPQAVSVFPQQH